MGDHGVSRIPRRFDIPSRSMFVGGTEIEIYKYMYLHSRHYSSSLAGICSSSSSRPTTTKTKGCRFGSIKWLIDSRESRWIGQACNLSLIDGALPTTTTKKHIENVLNRYWTARRFLFHPGFSNDLQKLKNKQRWQTRRTKVSARKRPFIEAWASYLGILWYFIGSLLILFRFWLCPS